MLRLHAFIRRQPGGKTRSTNLAEFYKASGLTKAAMLAAHQQTSMKHCLQQYQNLFSTTDDKPAYIITAIGVTGSCGNPVPRGPVPAGGMRATHAPTDVWTTVARRGASHGW